jgi:hypothetical protein
MDMPLIVWPTTRFKIRNNNIFNEKNTTLSQLGGAYSTAVLISP